RWKALDLPHVDWWSEVPSARVEVPPAADCILAVGGGSAIDTGKFASATAEKPIVHVPTTYSGAEWTTFYGIRTPDRRIQGGGAGRPRARARRPCARACDGAGARRHLRRPARRDERALPSARARLQPTARARRRRALRTGDRRRRGRADTRACPAGRVRAAA